MNNPSRPLDVAVGVVYDARGRVLVNQRPAGKSFPHKWEFPGGKIDGGESPSQALARELDEELGIAVKRQRPLISLRHEYDSGAVRLHVSEVLAFSGVPHGREGQVLKWVEPVELRRLDLLAANTAIVGAIMLPRFCLITDAQRFGVEETLQMLVRHLHEGRKLVIVREKAMERHALSSFVARVRTLCRSQGSFVCVHADSDFNEFEQADGIHLSADRLAGDGVPEDAGLVGVSCHTAEELENAGRLGAAYALLSPVRKTASHPDAEPLGWDRFAGLCDEAMMPVYALGGLELSDFPKAVDSGAQGVALLSAAWRRPG